MNDGKVRKVNMSRWNAKFKKSFSYGYMFVRDPFQRALSGYYNKVLPHNYLNGAKWSLSQYFEHLVADNIENQHFRSQITICDPCFLGIDYLGRQETLADDFEVLIYEKTSLHKNVTFDRSSRNEKLNLKKTKYKPHDLVLSQLNKPLFKKFVWKYRLDYIAFGYNPNTILSKL